MEKIFFEHKVLNLECAQLFAIDIQERNGKFQWIWHIKETVSRGF
jgi:hypothetical protein